jgi:hypothetical protein
VSRTSVSKTGEASLISIELLDDIHVAKLQERLPSCRDGRHTSPKVVCRLQGNVIADFGPQEVLVPRGRRPRDQPLEEPSQRFHFRS